ncbi:hypothetical protein M427DRAFT_152957 [Gonapodya prolifera JEL478]|uniref:Uncharacterized protein n=1 Tax=Gonapodya prolifera (strain JEL478) TaxID=1344416 RepID=A0A139ARB8_GONPJ|nr:hypothetical protein M427DRAFT_152957 [Gonapodya prolifera JEL478]|eukprot:KXS19035.1 hypothetical protein M427DRAFT_152957 [Gonapodya prolifera JEL478]
MASAATVPPSQTPTKLSRPPSSPIRIPRASAAEVEEGEPLEQLAAEESSDEDSASNSSRSSPSPERLSPEAETAQAVPQELPAAVVPEQSAQDQVPATSPPRTPQRPLHPVSQSMPTQSHSAFGRAAAAQASSSSSSSSAAAAPPQTSSTSSSSGAAFGNGLGYGYRRMHDHHSDELIDLTESEDYVKSCVETHAFLWHEDLFFRESPRARRSYLSSSPAGDRLGRFLVSSRTPPGGNHFGPPPGRSRAGTPEQGSPLSASSLLSRKESGRKKEAEVRELEHGVWEIRFEDDLDDEIGGLE